MPLDSLYWVITHNCNDHCDHCYNSSKPKGVELTLEEIRVVISHFPPKSNAPHRIIISGGEPLVNRQKLFHCLDLLYAKYGEEVQYMLQTNGDLLTPEILDEVLAHHITRIDIASIDRYHKHKGERAEILKSLFESRGMIFDNDGALISKERLLKHTLTFSMWGSNESFWIGGNWPRGRAVQTNTMLKNPHHNFCAITSGAKGFAGGGEALQEIAVQLYNLYPCCPGTKMPIADLRYEELEVAIARVIQHPMWKALNEGNPYKMGEYKGITETEAAKRIEALGNICLWCDEFFQFHFEGYIPNATPPHLNLHTAVLEAPLPISLPILNQTNHSL